MEKIVEFIQKVFSSEKMPLHAPVFNGNEKKYLIDTIDSNFVSSVGEYVNRFEKEVAEYTGSPYAVATVNGTAALHTALVLAGVTREDEVITQSLSFIATCNAITYTGAQPVFVDIDRETLGMSPESLGRFLASSAEKRPDGFSYNKRTGKRLVACVPMHTFGHPVRIDKIAEICADYNIFLIEDAAESLGSYYKGKHTGTFGKIGVFSFNGNKVITTGGGGILVCADEALAKKAKHITTTAKVPHPYEFIHDTTGYNYRMPNVNAALGVAQLEQLDHFLKVKRELFQKYQEFFRGYPDWRFVQEPEGAKSNYWLNALIFKDLQERNRFLEVTNKAGVMTRPVWKLMHHLEMFKNCEVFEDKNSVWIEERLVNIPSGAAYSD